MHIKIASDVCSQTFGILYLNKFGSILQQTPSSIQTAVCDTLTNYDTMKYFSSEKKNGAIQISSLRQ